MCVMGTGKRFAIVMPKLKCAVALMLKTDFLNAYRHLLTQSFF